MCLKERLALTAAIAAGNGTVTDQAHALTGPVGAQRVGALNELPR
jgi:hypothetical protein